MNEKNDQSFWQDIMARGVRAVVGQMSDQSSIACMRAYGTTNYDPIPVNVMAGNGAWVRDGTGADYIDCIGSYSAMAPGHLNPFLCRTVLEQMERLTLVSRALCCSELSLFLKGLCLFADVELACPMNTGAEAVETCLKIARKWAYKIKGIETNQAEVIVAEGNFHGRTISIISFSTEEKYRQDFGPFTPGFRTVPFGSLKDLENAFNPNTAAVLLEPIQADGGVIVPQAGYLEGARRLCDQHGVLLIWDEIQTGLCRTGRRFAWQFEDAKPDMMAIGKALGGGILPVSAAVGSRAVFDVLKAGEHGSTFGGNPLACSVALAALALMETEDYSTKAAERGQQIREVFARRAHPAIVDIRGKGLLLGVDIAKQIDMGRLNAALLANGILTKETRPRTFRIAPPLTIDAGLAEEIALRFIRSVEAAAQ